MMTPHFVSYSHAGKPGYGLHTEEGVIDLSSANPQYPTLREVIAADALKEIFMQAAGRAADLPLEAVMLEPPIPAPDKIICVGVNYPDRNAEYKDGQAAPSKPSLFIRFPGSFVGHGANLVRPPESEQLDYEGEIVLVIGKGGRRIPRDEAYDHVAALTLCNEGTIRDWVRHAKFNVTQGKNWDRSGAIGPWLVPFTNAAQLDDIALECRVNGEVRQQDRTSRMIYDFRYIINYVSTFCTLVPGDVLVCGTPTGAGARLDPPVWLKPGDVIEVEAEGIGVLRNGVEDEV
ncbi:fumarylacetoacetate (FAA) hydrolase [Mameliella alba]|nr:MULTISPECIES: fumarylacetoacetate hydrolase family protein [Mameliella]MCR9273314.1 fumarylacetoacetate hydrolase family protein [Paracoccaceae bacterium]OWV58236.1 2-hydroxyhepta-2,4-diene-1,7-dioate isomerase [Mameliella alba]BBU57498.1 fumarylacetoacetate (FAA) hydrolase [Mameliella alba]